MRKRFRVCIIIVFIAMVSVICGTSKSRAENLTITFSDINLYNCMKSELKSKIVDSSDESQSIVMTEEGVKSVSSLFLDGKNITNLDGIESFTNLFALYIDGNHITSIEKIPGQGLSMLSLSYVEDITDLSLLANYEKLTTLKISQSKLEEIPEPIIGLKNITTFSWEDGVLTTTSWIKEFPSIKSLSVKNNRISNLENLSTLSELTTLDVSYNMLENIDEIGKCSKLNSLDIRSNKIKSLNGISDLKLGYLYAQNNYITDISQLNMEKITALNIENNCISNMGIIKDIAIEKNFNISGQLVRMDVKSGAKVTAPEILKQAKENFQATDIELLNCKLNSNGKIEIDENVTYARAKINDGSMKNSIIFFNVNNIQVAGVTNTTINLTKTQLIVIFEVMIIMIVSVLILAKVKQKKKQRKGKLVK